MKILIINNRNEESLIQLLKSLEINILGNFSYAIYDASKKLENEQVINVEKNISLKEWLVRELQGEKDDLYTIIDENKFCISPFNVSSVSETMSNPDVFCFSLSLGKNITHCSNMNCDNIFIPIEETDGILTWDWSVHYFDFGYPLNLDGTIFRGKELLKFVKSISFSDSLELENSLQIFDNYPKTIMASFEEGKMVELIFENQNIRSKFDYKKLKGDRIKYQILESNENADKISDEVKA